MIPPSIPPPNEAKSLGKESQAWRQAGRCKALRSLLGRGETKMETKARGEGGWG